MAANYFTSDLPPAYSTVHQGFLLTRSSHDRNNSTQIEYWVSTDEGPARLLIDDERPVFFIAIESAEIAAKVLSRLRPQVEIRKLDLRQFNGQTTAAVYSQTINDHFTAQDQLQHHGVEMFESDLRLHDRYLMERFAYGSVAFVGERVARHGFMEYRNCRIKSSDYRPDLTLLSLDIECDMDGTLYSVGLAGPGASDGSATNEVLMIGNPENSQHTTIYWFADEPALLIGLRDRIQSIDPDLLIGWNLINFDMQILLKRAEKFKIPFSIGRNNRIATWRDVRGDVGKGFVNVPGRVAIDGIDALKAATWSFPSFSLENVSQTLLSRGKKVEKDVDDRLAEIQHNFRHNKPALAAYNLEDCQLVLDIFHHTRIVEFLVLRSKITGLELDRAGGSVAAFTNLYLPRLHRG
ncbi:MAG: 3'-5' exonuclease, partial [bacterium]